MKKIIVLLFGITLSLNVLAHTLMIDAKKFGQTRMKITHLYVQEAGYNSLGVFIVRFMNGHEISLGKKSDWEIFEPKYVDDFDQILH